MLGAHEDDHAVEFGDLEDARDGVELVAVRGEQVALRDVRVRARFRLDGDLGGVVEVLLGNPADTVGHRRGEQRHLLVVRGVFEDALHVLLEAHVEHLVRLVEHEEAQVGDVQRALLQVVDDAARGTHDDLRAAAQTRQLDAVRLPAVDRQHGDAAEVVREGLEGVGYLQRQLTCRCEHQRLRVARFLVNPGEDGQRERRRLARTRLREADHVAALHQQRDRLRLDRRRLLKAHFADRVQHIVGEVERVEAVAYRRLLSPLPAVVLSGSLVQFFFRGILRGPILVHVPILFCSARSLRNVLRFKLLLRLGAGLHRIRHRFGRVLRLSRGVRLLVFSGVLINTHHRQSLRQSGHYSHFSTQGLQLSDEPRCLKFASTGEY